MANKLKHRPAEDTYKGHLEAMRANYLETPIRHKHMKRPLWTRLIPESSVNDLFKEGKILLSHASVYYACLVQANSGMFEEGNRRILPGLILYSVDPIANDDPTILQGIAHDLYEYKGAPAAQIPPALREAVAIVTDERDFSPLDFQVPICSGDPRDPNVQKKMLEVHLRTILFFPKDLPGGELHGPFLPLLASGLTKAIMILPKEYWTKQRFE